MCLWCMHVVWSLCTFKVQEILEVCELCICSVFSLGVYEVCQLFKLCVHAYVCVCV